MHKKAPHPAPKRLSCLQSLDAVKTVLWMDACTAKALLETLLRCDGPGSRRQALTCHHCERHGLPLVAHTLRYTIKSMCTLTLNCSPVHKYHPISDLEKPSTIEAQRRPCRFGKLGLGEMLWQPGEGARHCMLGGKNKIKMLNGAM